VSIKYQDIKDDEKILDSNEVKLAYVIKTLGLVTKDIAKELGVTSSLISQIKNHYEDSNRLRNIHLYAICFAYDIPIEIFKDKGVDSAEKIDFLLSQKSQSATTFSTNQEVMDKLTGEWYMYSYPSNSNLTDVWETKTVFYDDYSVIDEHDNKGTLHVGQNQSIILKESTGSKNITSITFDNSRVFYNVFLFSRVSKSNNMNKELFNFGICSRKKLDKNEVKKILGAVNEVQLQVNYEMLERISSITQMDD